jgi:hypothetical protein
VTVLMPALGRSTRASRWRGCGGRRRGCPWAWRPRRSHRRETCSCPLADTWRVEVNGRVGDITSRVSEAEAEFKCGDSIMSAEKSRRERSKGLHLCSPWSYFATRRSVHLGNMQYARRVLIAVRWVASSLSSSGRGVGRGGGIQGETTTTEPLTAPFQFPRRTRTRRWMVNGA